MEMESPGMLSEMDGALCEHYGCFSTAKPSKQLHGAQA